MATRLEITHGLISERDRLSTSADTLSVTRPTTGSKIRSKGVLFVLVSSTLPGPQTRGATRLVADTIRHEYYYDESAGVPVCLEKAVKSADRRLRGSREGAGLPPGSLGVAAAVVRNNELYLATLGAAEAYLVRSARLLMPDRSAPGGLPSDDGRGVEVWRGELHVGDGLLLVSRNMTETVGTEELKSAVLTLHPQAAVEHLHHLFVAAGGSGSDGIISVEAAEQTTRVRGTVAPATAASGDLPPASPVPVGGVAELAGSVGSLRERFWAAMPRRRTSPTQVTASTSRAETQRRAAMGLLALVAVIFVAGLLLVLVPPGSDAEDVPRIAGSDSALAAALDDTNRADNLLATEPERALAYYRDAWDEVSRARRTGLSAPALDDLERRIRAGLDELYDARTLSIERIARLPTGSEPAYLVEDRIGGAVFLDRETWVVRRINVKNGKDADIVAQGDKQKGTDRTIGRPVELAAAGPDVIIVDDNARPWRWRPSNSAGKGTLARLSLQGRAGFEADHGDVEAYDPASAEEYRLYVIEPSLNQIMRYQQTFDGSSFQEPSPYLVSQTAEVGDFEQLYIDFDVYALFDDTLRRHVRGRYDGTFMLETPPDDEDIRPGHDYRLVAGSGRASDLGRAYIYDARHGRLIGFDKADGSYLGQWHAGGDGSELADVRGMYVIEGGLNKKRTKRKNDTLVWVTPEGLYQAVLPTG